MPAKEVTAALIAENTFTAWIIPKTANHISDAHTHFLNVSIAGTWVGTITLQRRFGSNDSESSRDITGGSWTENAEEELYDHEEGVEYRIGFKTSDYTSGTANVRLGA